MNTRAAHPVALVADPDVDARSVYTTHLLRGGYAIEEADDGREALARALVGEPNVIVAAAYLSGIDTYALCQLLRSDRDTCRIPIVMFGGVAGDTDIDRAQAIGVDCILTTPCLPETLLDAIERLVDRPRRQLTPSYGGGSTTRRSPWRDRVRTLDMPLTGMDGAGDTRSPLLLAPPLVCPECYAALVYECSHTGGVSERHREQWDDFRCPRRCGDFQYRHRTRKLKRRIA